MLGTFGGALEARTIEASGGKLIAEVRGEVESEGGVLMIRRVYVKFRLQAPADAQPVVERVHRIYAEKCPVYRTLRPALEIHSTYELV
ncbi:MAG TPA: OsmC family protein [Terriglobales bacterium]|nr:OsmC family protein [Terriglobales bacterium]